jgi:hypothetical protein
MKIFRQFLPVVLALSHGIIPCSALAEGPYHLLKEIPVPGEGGWDYLSVDAGAHRLYVTHATKVVVIDLTKDQVVGEVTDTPGVRGFAIASRLHRGFSSNGKEAKVSIVDLETLKTISKVDTGENPDAILYEAGRNEVYAFNGRGKSVTVFDASSGAIVATIPLSGKPEFAASDPEAGRVYCNIEDKNEVAVIDTNRHAVVASWPIAPGASASSMTLDQEHHRLFLGCHNKIMVMMDSANGHVIAQVPIGDGVDANAFDAGTQLAFSSCGDGNVTIVHEDTPDKLTVVQTLASEPKARTMALDPVTHRIYLVSARFGPFADAKSRPQVIAGSLKILVFEMLDSPARNRH